MFDFGLGKIGTAAIIGAVVLAIVGGAAWWINDSAFNRGDVAGAARVTQQMKAAIEKQRQAVVADFARLKSMDRPALEKELWQKCMAAPNGSEAVCGAKP